MSTPTPTEPRRDPFLEEVRRLKEEAAGNRDVRELAEELRRIEARYRDRVVQPPQRPGTSAA